MAVVDELTKALQDVHLGGLLDDCVIIIEDDKAYITAMELSSSLFIQASAEFEFGDDKIGISTLALFTKYLSTLNGEDVKFKRKDNVLTVKPKGGTQVKYVLADYDLIPTYDEEWEESGNVIEAEIAEFGENSKIKLTQQAVSEFLKHMNMFSPNSVYINITGKGKVTMHGGGNANENQFDVNLGTIKGADECSIRIYGKHLTAVLNAVDFKNKPFLYVEDGQESIIVDTETTSWLLRSTIGEEN